MQPTGNSTERIALDILQSGINLPPLPAVFTRLIALSRQPEERIDIAKFTKLMQTDPALTARILQLANSSYYGTLNKISNLRQAIMHIGLQETIATVNWMLCQKVLPQFPVMEGFSDRDYWAHSWACATANRMLGRPDLQVVSQPGELYVAGLLHGIGRLILALHKPEEFQRCLINSRDFSQPLEDAELELLGTTDADIACEILRAWHFPESICNAVKYCRNPQAAPDEYLEMAALTQFAYFIANTSGIGNNGDEFSYNFYSTYLANLEGSPFADRAIRRKLIEEIHQTLQKKSVSVTGVTSTIEPAQEPSPAEEFRSRPQRFAAAKPKSLWERLTSALTGVFHRST